MDRNAIVGVMLLHCVFVFTEAFLQGSAGFTDVDTVTFSARDFINYSFLNSSCHLCVVSQAYLLYRLSFKLALTRN